MVALAAKAMKTASQANGRERVEFAMRVYRKYRDPDLREAIWDYAMRMYPIDPGIVLSMMSTHLMFIEFSLELRREDVPKLAKLAAMRVKYECHRLVSLDALEVLTGIYHQTFMSERGRELERETTKSATKKPAPKVNKPSDWSTISNKYLRWHEEGHDLTDEKYFLRALENHFKALGFNRMQTRQAYSTICHYLGSDTAYRETGFGAYDGHITMVGWELPVDEFSERCRTWFRKYGETLTWDAESRRFKSPRAAEFVAMLRENWFERLKRTPIVPYVGD